MWGLFPCIVVGKRLFDAGKHLLLMMSSSFGSNKKCEEAIENVRNDEVGLKNDRQFKLRSRFGLAMPVNTSVVIKNKELAVIFVTFNITR